LIYVNKNAKTDKNEGENADLTEEIEYNSNKIPIFAELKIKYNFSIN
jgi:hypothetical protein